MNVLDVVAAALVLVGAGFTLVAGIGLQRFDDVFARIHAATKAATFGLLLIVGGAVVGIDSASGRVKLVLVAALQLVTAPIGAHMIGRASHRAGSELSPATVVDELAEAERRPR